MNISLIGYGKMGKEIEKIALERGHNIISIIDKRNQKNFDSKPFLTSNIAIEFTQPETAFDNCMKCFQRNIPVVSGTTGWLKDLDKIKKECLEKRKTFFYASNYSIGVNLFFEFNRTLAKIMNHFSQYEPRIEEIHHMHKLDSPSGTALTLAKTIADNIKRKTMSNLSISSERRGEITGIHTVFYESDLDKITIQHEAKNRKGFAFGAILAAEYTQGKIGFLTMEDLLKL